jgi:RNA polymerase sigma-70 factor, ECF subfamily
MDGLADGLAGGFVSADDDLAREFEQRLVESSTLAFRVAYGVLRHREDAEDVAQEAFVKAYRSFRQLRDRDRFRAWLVRITWRLAIDRRRGERRRTSREADPEAVQSTAGFDVAGSVHPAAMDEMMTRERSAHLWQAIDALPEKLRVVVVLAGIEEQRLDEVARLLDLPEGTVKSRLFVARRRLKELLQWTIGERPTA